MKCNNCNNTATVHLTEIKGGDNVTFEVPFTNQGEVQLTEDPRGDRPGPGQGFVQFPQTGCRSRHSWPR